MHYDLGVTERQALSFLSNEATYLLVVCIYPEAADSLSFPILASF